MRKTILIPVFALLSFSLLSAQGFFSKTDAFLKKNVSYGKVDYAGIKAAPSELNDLVSMVGSYSLSGKSKSEAKAFWINAYNILVIKNVVNHYPISKPLDVPGFFDKIKMKIAGSSLTLSDIENKKIRPTYKDARVHFALVCAAKSCPPLANYAFMPSKIDAQLTAITKKAMDNKYFIKVSDENKTVKFSKIFEWYKADFLAEAKDIRSYINKYRSSEIGADYKESFYTYNWALNVKKK